MNKSSIINWKKLEDSHINEIINNDILFTKNNFENTIQFYLFNKIFEFEYPGIKIIKTRNTNKFLRNLFDANGEALIYLDKIRVKTKNIVLISPLTRITDVITNKINGDLNNYIKDNDSYNDIKIMEETILKIYNNKGESFKQVADIDLTKTSLINFVNINDDFINYVNIEYILDIMKTPIVRKLIIFNDVDYLNISLCEKWFNYFDFLYIVSSIEENWKSDAGYNEIILVHKNDTISEIWSLF